MCERARLPRIAVFTTGGTIGSRLDPVTGGVSAVATAEELLSTVPDLADEVQAELHPLASVSSWDVTPRLMLEIANTLEATLARPEIDGAVITHGTDTVEETSLLVDLIVQSDKPIVFVASMRNLSELGGDGPRNLRDAMRVASSPEARGRGALLVVNETIHSARYVTKGNTVNPATFESPDFGPVGLISGGVIRFLHPAHRGVTVPEAQINADVHLIKAVTGMDDRELRRLVDEGVAGIVLEGSGAGNIPSAMVPGVIAALKHDIPVLLTSRVLRGFLSPTYGTGKASGGGFDLVNLGVIPAQHLPSQKARIKLMVALAQPPGALDLRAFFAMP